jgi:DNA-binding MarR family transcriptional regulator
MAKKEAYSIPCIRTWLLLTQMFGLMFKHEEDEFAKIGLTIQQFFMIAAIHFLQPPVTPTDLSQYLYRKLNTVTLTLDRMEKTGLVKKKRDLPDRRTLRVMLTPKSKKLFAKAAQTFTRIPTDIMSCLSDDELGNYSDLTHKLGGNLFDKLGMTEFKSHRINTMNHILQEGSTSVEPIHIEPFRSKDMS